MKIIFIVDDSAFLIPQWLDQTLSELSGKHTVIAITPLNTKSKLTWESYLMQNIGKLGTMVIIKAIHLGLKSKINEILFALRFTSVPATIGQVAQKNKIKILKSTDINAENYLSQLKGLKPDIIISSCSQIFKKDLLNIPKLACINRHSALLPSYGGVFPIFWAILNQEKQIGVTLHKMIEKIDEGNIIYQCKIPVNKSDTLYGLYEKAYRKSVAATIRAIEILENNKPPIQLKVNLKSYYSFPKNTDWNKFFEFKRQII